MKTIYGYVGAAISFVALLISMLSGKKKEGEETQRAEDQRTVDQAVLTDQRTVDNAAIAQQTAIVHQTEEADAIRDRFHSDPAYHDSVQSRFERKD